MEGGEGWRRWAIGRLGYTCRWQFIILWVYERSIILFRCSLSFVYIFVSYVCIHVRIYELVHTKVY